MKRAQALIDRGLDPLFETSEVTSPELDLLVTLRHTDEPVTARHIMRITNRSAAGVSKTLRKLQARQLVDKRPHETDRRSTLISITNRGRDIVDDLFPRQLAAEAVLLANLNVEEHEAIAASLTALVEALQNAAAHTD